MLHCQYLRHLQKYLSRFASESDLWKLLDSHRKEFTILVDINLDPVLGILESLYCPNVRKEHRDPVEMMRSLLLMSLLKESSITEWVATTRSLSLYAIMSGFHPGDVPGVGTYYDFMKRIIDGPYHRLLPGELRRSCFNAGRHIRNLKEEKSAGKDELNPHQSQSKKLADELLCRSHQPRPEDFRKVLDDLLMRVGIEQSIECGLLNNVEDLAVSGDGSALATASSGHGKPTCNCRSEGVQRCNHDRSYTSPTAQWCYDHHHDRIIFADRYYLIVVHQNGHDLPVQITMPGGNESDYTLSLKALDRLLKAIVESSGKIRVTVFIGDGHHDSYAHYEYLDKKGILPVIPLSEKSEKTYPHLLHDQGIRMDADGTPLCPAGVRMRHHQYDRNKHTHVYCCPAKRNSHLGGKSVYLLHLEECPSKQDCAPESLLGPIVYIKSTKDLRLFPPLPRSSRRFKELMKQRSACERGNAVMDSYGVDRSCRNADYGLIRLNLIGIVQHAVVRHIEAAKQASPVQLFVQALEKVSVRFPLPYQDTG